MKNTVVSVCLGCVLIVSVCLSLVACQRVSTPRQFFIPPAEAYPQLSDPPINQFSSNELVNAAKLINPPTLASLSTQLVASSSNNIERRNIPTTSIPVPSRFFSLPKFSLPLLDTPIFESQSLSTVTTPPPTTTTFRTTTTRKTTTTLKPKPKVVTRKSFIVSTTRRPIITSTRRIPTTTNRFFRNENEKITSFPHSRFNLNQRPQRIVTLSSRPIPAESKIASKHIFPSTTKKPIHLTSAKISQSQNFGHVTSKPINQNQNFATTKPRANQIQNFGQTNSTPKTNQNPIVAATSIQSKTALPPKSDEGSSKYNFNWSVNNVETNDVKSHKESRQNDVIVGEYSVLQPDGSTLTVSYTSSATTGFRAKVSRKFLNKT